MGRLGRVLSTVARASHGAGEPLQLRLGEGPVLGLALSPGPGRPPRRVPPAGSQRQPPAWSQAPHTHPSTHPCSPLSTPTTPALWSPIHTDSAVTLLPALRGQPSSVPLWPRPSGWILLSTPFLIHLLSSTLPRPQSSPCLPHLPAGTAGGPASGDLRVRTGLAAGLASGHRSAVSTEAPPTESLGLSPTGICPGGKAGGEGGAQADRKLRRFGRSSDHS